MGVNISQFIRLLDYLVKSVTLIIRITFITAKILEHGHRYHQLRKIFYVYLV